MNVTWILHFTKKKKDYILVGIRRLIYSFVCSPSFRERKSLDINYLLDRLCLCLQAQERFESYPPWALVMCFALIFVAMLPLPVVYIVRRFNLMSDGSNKLSVSYRKTMMKDISNLEEQGESRFILGAKPGEAPASAPERKAFLTPGGTKPLDTNSLSPNVCYGTSYQNAAISPTTPTTPESDS